LYYIGISDIPLDKVFEIIQTELVGLFTDHPEIYLIVPAIGGLFALYYLIRSIYGRRKLALENTVFIAFCSIVLFIMAASFLMINYDWLTHEKYLSIALYLAITSLPSFFCLHIWTQVSHKKVKISTRILYFIVPVFVTAAYAKTIFIDGITPDVWSFFDDLTPVGYVTAVYIIYWFCMTLKSFRLCFNVFYQMPRHMQGSTLLLISALVGATAVNVLALVIGTKSCYLLYILMLIFIMNRAYSGFFRASASNVIATSRQFVFSNLSTQIFILSRKGRILEWNTPQDNYLIRTTQPKYLQPYTDYREKLIEAGAGIVSPHDSNVLTLTIGDKEHDILIHRHPISEGKKQFGELIEITEVTNIYTVLHQMEQISFVDQMTGLRNRNAYITKAQDIMTQENMPLLIFVGDVNNLKNVNDKLGHVVGDRMLTDVAEILKGCAPEDAFLARIGGDEFAMLIPNADEALGGQYIANVEEKCDAIFDEEYGRPNVSIGYAVARSAIEDYNTVFEEADAYMYSRKKVYKEQTNPGRQLSGMLPEEIQPVGDTPLSAELEALSVPPAPPVPPHRSPAPPAPPVVPPAQPAPSAQPASPESPIIPDSPDSPVSPF
jgi:diguanylate cyclase (GGDEF)-like protein